MTLPRYPAGFTLLLALAIAPLAASAQTYVCLETNKGDICLDLLPEAAPNTVSNFLNYVTDGDYDNTLIHRSSPGVIIQGGGFHFMDGAITTVATDPEIPNEFSRSNVRGTVAMARFPAEPDSAAGEWFINIDDNIGLDDIDGGFTVFAEVVLGMDIAEQINGFPLFDLSGTYGTAFTHLPADAPAGVTDLYASELIVVERAYTTDVLPGTVVVPPLLPYQCSATSLGDTLTEFCGTTLTFPAAIGGLLYEATLTYRPDLPGLAFSADRSTLKLIADIGQNHAIFSNNQLVIPDVRIGAKVYQQVVMQMTSFADLEFAVQTYTEL